jgi:hypothetical protein
MEPEGIVLRGQDSTFLIRIGDGTLDLSSLTVAFTGPSGSRARLSLIPEPSLRRVRVVVRPSEVGLHVGVVSYGPFHLPGSPFNSLVGRDYASLTGPILNLDLEQECDDGQLTPKKPWGLCSNTLTEEVRVFPSCVVVSLGGKEVYCSVSNPWLCSLVCFRFW